MAASGTGTTLGVSVGSRCYVPDAQHMWLPAVVEDVDELKRTATVRLEPLDGSDSSDGERRVVPVAVGAVLPLQNAAPQLGGCDDMTELNHLHEAAILDNLTRRFHARKPYTYTGDICVALNPYEWLDELYSPTLHTQYLRAPSRALLPPHVYAVAVAAYRHMAHSGSNQSILVSGESGAGKTETTKIVMDNLATIARASGGSHASVQAATVARILEVNPLLESFGNAKTKRNDNSSRFGKFTQLQFDASHALCGAKCETYLLEKTRVVTQDAGERNYHIFYQLLHGATQAEREIFGLESVESSQRFAYVRQEDQDKADVAAKDARNLAKTKHALSLLGLSPRQQEALFQCIAGILHLGEATFSPRPDNDDASMLSSDSVAYSSVLLGLETAAMDRALCSRTMKAGGEVYAVPLSTAHAVSCRDALAKALYARLFDWIVARVNASLSAPDAAAPQAIGVLDIFGFESFVHNSYEQLCINYANEKLQQKFTQDVFASVADEYARERISWAHIEYADNRDVLALLESKLGVLALLNEELVRPKGSDEGFVGKLAAQFRTSKHVVEFARLSRTQFTVHHYADSVQYEALGFLEKHKDALLPDLSALMRASSERFLRELFETKKEETPAAVAEPSASTPVSRKPVGRSGSGGSGSDASATVGTQFKVSLNRLMDNIGLTNVHYIRCIKPNSVKSPRVIDAPMVVAQLRCAGVIEAISIVRAGYPNRLLHAAFASEFAIFLSDAEREASSDDAAVAHCTSLVRQFALQTPAEYQMGTTKIYLQKGVLEKLEHARAAKLFAFAARIQSAWRGLCAHRQYVAMRCALVLMQRRAKVFVAVRRLARMRAAVALVQRVWRGVQGRRVFFAVLCEHRALQIQRVYRGHAGRRAFSAVLRAARAVRIQCAVRCFLARRELSQRQATHAREQAELRELARQQRAEQARLYGVQREQSAGTIQRLVRGFLARSAVAKLVAQVAAEKRRLQQEAEAEENERLRVLAEEAERVRQQQLAEEQQRREEEERERQRLLAEEKQRREEEERERQRQLELQREEEERQRQQQLALQREAEKQKHAAVTVQKLTRGRLARQQFAVLKVEAAREMANDAELLAARDENARLRQQLEEILEANIELENLVTEWTLEREVLDASNHVKELELRQRISAKKQQLEAAHAEYTMLAEQLGSKNRSRSATETVDSNGSTETETLSSASERDDDDDDDDDDEDWAEHPHQHDDPDLDADRPSTDVSRLLERRSRMPAAPRFSNALKQPTAKSSQLLRAGANRFGLAKKWVNTAAAARRTGRAAKVHGETDANATADSPVLHTKSGERGVAL